MSDILNKDKMKRKNCISWIMLKDLVHKFYFFYSGLVDVSWEMDTWKNQKFCHILVWASLWCIYKVTKAAQAVESICYSW